MTVSSPIKWSDQFRGRTAIRKVLPTWSVPGRREHGGKRRAPIPRQVDVAHGPRSTPDRLRLNGVPEYNNRHPRVMLIFVKDAERPCAERKVLPSTTGTVIQRAASTREKCPPWQCFIT